MGSNQETLKMRGLSAFLVFLSAALCVNAGHYYRRYHPRRPAPFKSIAEIVVGDPRFSTLLAAVKAAGLVETLSGPGTFTVFAPSNDAFAKIPTLALNDLLSKPEALKAVLLRHVLPNKILSFDIPKGSTPVRTVGGEDITVVRTYSKIKIQSSAGQARVVIPDVKANNGVIHAVDTVF